MHETFFQIINSMDFMITAYNNMILMGHDQGIIQDILTLRLKGFASNFHTPKYKFL